MSKNAFMPNFKYSVRGLFIFMSLTSTSWAHSSLFTTLCNQWLGARVKCFRFCFVVTFSKCTWCLCGECVCVCWHWYKWRFGFIKKSEILLGIHRCKFHCIVSKWPHITALWHEIYSYWKLSVSDFLFIRILGRRPPMWISKN